MSTTALKELLEEDAVFFPLGVGQYHAMIEGGILPEGAPYELLNGYVVRKDRSAAGEDPMTISHAHAWVVTTLGSLDSRLRRLGCHIRLQQPVTLPPSNEPEPDASIILGAIDDYRERHPLAKDVLCVIEVADASLQHDRTVKSRIYARANIPHFFIVNLPDRVIEVYSEPVRRSGRYQQSAILRANQRVAFPAAAGRTFGVAVRTLLP